MIAARITSRNLTRRLERLEQRILPTCPEYVIHVIYVNRDGTQAPGGFTIYRPSHGPAQLQRQTPVPSRLVREGTPETQ